MHTDQLTLTLLNTHAIYNNTSSCALEGMFTCILAFYEITKLLLQEALGRQKLSVGAENIKYTRNLCGVCNKCICLLNVQIKKVHV